MRNDFKDYYRILGVRHDANPTEIKRAYRNLAKRYHPDRNGGNTSKFQDINEAQEVLLDPTIRSEFDAWIIEMVAESKRKAEEEILRRDTERIRKEKEEEEKDEEERVARVWAKKRDEWEARSKASQENRNPIWDDPAHNSSTQTSTTSVSGVRVAPNRSYIGYTVAIILLLIVLLVVIIDAINKSTGGTSRISSKPIDISNSEQPASASVPTSTECSLVVFTPDNGHVEWGKTLFLINGGVEPRPSDGRPVRVWIETRLNENDSWMRTDVFREFNIPTGKELGFSSAKPFEFSMGNLVGVKFYFRLVAASDCGVFYGKILGFSEGQEIINPALIPEQPTPEPTEIPTAEPTPIPTETECVLIPETPTEAYAGTSPWGQSMTFMNGKVLSRTSKRHIVYYWVELRKDKDASWEPHSSPIESWVDAGRQELVFTNASPIKLLVGRIANNPFYFRLIVRNHCGIFYGDIRAFSKESGVVKISELTVATPESAKVPIARPTLTSAFEPKSVPNRPRIIGGRSIYPTTPRDRSVSTGRTVGIGQSNNGFTENWRPQNGPSRTSPRNTADGAYREKSSECRMPNVASPTLSFVEKAEGGIYKYTLNNGGVRPNDQFVTIWMETRRNSEDSWSVVPMSASRLDTPGLPSTFYPFKSITGSIRGAAHLRIAVGNQCGTVYSEIGYVAAD